MALTPQQQQHIVRARWGPGGQPQDPTPPPQPARPARPAGDKQAARERLAAGAQGGRPALDDYDRARADIEQARKQAISGMTRDAALVGGQGTLGALNAMISAPAIRQEGDLRQAGAEFRTQQAALNSATSRYSLEAAQAKDAAIAEIRAAAARARASSGGGGGGGGGGHRGSSLTDAQLGKALMNAAFENRKSTIAALTGRINKYAGIEKVVNAKRQQLDAQFAQRTGAAVGDAVRDPIKRIATPGISVAGGVGVSPEQVQAWQRMRDALIAQQAGTAAEPSGLAGIPTSDIAARTLALRSLANRSAYESNKLASRPLYPDARQIGYQYAQATGEDPTLIDALIGPKEEASFQSALKKLVPKVAQTNPAALAHLVAPAAEAAQLLAQDDPFYGDPKNVAKMVGQVQRVPKQDKLGQPLHDDKDNPVYESFQPIKYVIEQAAKAYSSGSDFDTFASWVHQLPYYQQYPRTYDLGLEMVRQRFEARQAAASGQQYAGLGG